MIIPRINKNTNKNQYVAGFSHNADVHELTSNAEKTKCTILKAIAITRINIVNLIVVILCVKVATNFSLKLGDIALAMILTTRISQANGVPCHIPLQNPINIVAAAHATTALKWPHEINSRP
jgi:hypothetical protein